MYPAIRPPRRRARRRCLSATPLAALTASAPLATLWRLACRRLTGLRKDAKRLRDGIDRLRPFRATHKDYSPDMDMEVASDVYFEKLLHNLDGIIDALGPPRKKSGSAARTNMGRDLFWSELLAIWRKIGGEVTGADAADFLIAVSRPVFKAMPRDARDAVPVRRSVIQWLRRRSPQG